MYLFPLFFWIIRIRSNFWKIWITRTCAPRPKTAIFVNAAQKTPQFNVSSRFFYLMGQQSTKELLNRIKDNNDTHHKILQCVHWFWINLRRTRFQSPHTFQSIVWSIALKHNFSSVFKLKADSCVDPLRFFPEQMPHPRYTAPKLFLFV